jgi:hypothetical protein
MSAQEHAAAVLRPGLEHEVTESGPVARGIARTRGASGALISKWEVDAKDADARRGDGAIHRHQQRRVTVRAGAVREDEGLWQERPGYQMIRPEGILETSRLIT